MEHGTYQLTAIGSVLKTLLELRWWHCGGYSVNDNGDIGICHNKLSHGYNFYSQYI